MLPPVPPADFQNAHLSPCWRTRHDGGNGIGQQLIVGSRLRGVAVERLGKGRRAIRKQAMQGIDLSRENPREVIAARSGKLRPWLGDECIEPRRDRRKS